MEHSDNEFVFGNSNVLYAGYLRGLKGDGFVHLHGRSFIDHFDLFYMTRKPEKRMWSHFSAVLIPKVPMVYERTLRYGRVGGADSRETAGYTHLYHMFREVLEDIDDEIMEHDRVVTNRKPQKRWTNSYVQHYMRGHGYDVR
jgi:hypothetical protein